MVNSAFGDSQSHRKKDGQEQYCLLLGNRVFTEKPRGLNLPGLLSNVVLVVSGGERNCSSSVTVKYTMVLLQHHGTKPLRLKKKQASEVQQKYVHICEHIIPINYFGIVRDNQSNKNANSIRMRTAHSSNRRGGGGVSTRHPPGAGTPTSPDHAVPPCGQTHACRHDYLAPNFICGR